VNTSVFLAKLIGPVSLLLGLGTLLNREAARDVMENFVRNRASVFLFGVITMPTGLAVVLTHNVWVADWPVLITVLGWIATFSGAVRIAAPQEAIKFARRVYEQPNGALTSGAIWIAIGAILCFFGYVK
jgi:uncharacterized protein YjeT (DUF2065 family)